MLIDAENLEFEKLNQMVRDTSEDVEIKNALGQRFIASASKGKNITIYGTPGNALGAYLDGSNIKVFGNAQDAVGDTMNNGKIIINGNAGDAAGYAMRGGEILVKGNVGYRAGIHMKAYADKLPVMVVGGAGGSFLGEYQAGGLIIVLGINIASTIVGHFCGTGMHGGKIFLRCNEIGRTLPAQVCSSDATDSDIMEIKPYIEEYCKEFGEDVETLLNSHYFVLTPNSSNPYKQLYVQN